MWLKKKKAIAEQIPLTIKKKSKATTARTSFLYPLPVVKNGEAKQAAPLRTATAFQTDEPITSSKCQLNSLDTHMKNKNNGNAARPATNKLTAKDSGFWDVLPSLARGSHFINKPDSDYTTGSYTKRQAAPN
jgi:hypothetical protein